MYEKSNFSALDCCFTRPPISEREKRTPVETISHKRSPKLTGSSTVNDFFLSFNVISFSYVTNQPRIVTDNTWLIIWVGRRPHFCFELDVVALSFQIKRTLKPTLTAVELHPQGYVTDPSYWNKLDEIYPDCWGQLMRNNCSPVCVSSKFLHKSVGGNIVRRALSRGYSDLRKSNSLLLNL